MTTKLRSKARPESWAQKLPFAASAMMSLSKVRSDTAFSQPLILFLKTLEFLQLVCAHSTVLFLPAVTGLFSHTNLSDRISKVGIEPHLTPHRFRHSAATLLIEEGVDIRPVQRLLGRASIATTEIYTKVSDNSLSSAVAAADTLAAVDD